MDTRSNMQGKVRALATATRVSESCLGLALLRNHDGEDRTYINKLRGLEKENRNIQNELEHQRKQFLKRRLGTPGPMIILEQTRAPAVPVSADGDGTGKRGRRPKPRGRETVKVREAEERNGRRRGYMMPTMSSGTVICSTSTLGAFRISTQRPLERWNPAALQKIYFKSTILPSWPLTESDLGKLRTTLSRHCWLRKFRDPGQQATAENGKQLNKSKRFYRGVGPEKVPNDEQLESNSTDSDSEDELEIPVKDDHKLNYSRGVNVRSRSQSPPTDFDSRHALNAKSMQVEQRYKQRFLPALTDRHRSKTVKPKTKLRSETSSSLIRVQPMLNSEEQFFKTAIEYSIPTIATDARNPDNNGDANNTIPFESLTRKIASASDALPEMTSTRNLLKSLRAVSFSDDVINIGCRTSEKDVGRVVSQTSGV